MEYFYIVVFLVGVFYTIASLIISGITGAFHSHGDISGGNVDGHIGHHGSIDAGHIHADAGHIGQVHGDLQGSHFHGGDMNAGHVHGGHMHGGHTDSGDLGDLKAENAGFSHHLYSWAAMLFNPLVAVSFLTVFGGMGIMGINYFKWNSVIIFLAALGSAIIVSVILYNFVAKPIYRSENTSDVSREELIGTPAEVTSDILPDGYGTIKYVVNSIMYTAPARHIDQKAVKQGEKVFICKIEENTFYISEVSNILN